MNPFELDDDEDEGFTLAEPVAAAPLATVDASPSSLANEKKARLDKLRAIEDEILYESSMTIRDALRFRDIDENDEEPPPAWVEELGWNEAMRRFRAAKAGQMSAKTAPVALSLAKATMVGITKARAADGASRQINIGVSVTMPSPGFTVMEVDGE